MSRKQYALTLVVALVAGLVGGTLSQTLFGSKIALADNDFITARGISLVDKDGVCRILLGADDGTGKPIISMKSGTEVGMFFVLTEKGPHILLAGDKPHIELTGINAKLELFGTNAELEINRIAKGAWTAP